ncbi:MAG: 50S ribosomal protein L11 methyltransferase [Burkholderiaceae bacterium]
MNWIEIVVEVPREHAEPLSDALVEAGALSVSVEDADVGTDAEQPLFGEPGSEPELAAWEHSRVVALTNANADHSAIVAAAAASCGIDDQLLVRSMRAVADQDWVRLTQSQFEPIHVGRNMWVVPSWRDAPDPTALVLKLDPGLAFGTGSHPTTRLCMEWLEANMPAGASVLDYGCGSGILAIVAKKLGASNVVGVDIDPQALASAQDNSTHNQCAIDLHLPGSFGTAVGGTQFDVVVANILSNPLKLMAPMLASRVAPHGALVLSGVLARQAGEVCAAYARFIRLEATAEQEGWVALVGRHGCAGAPTSVAQASGTLG